MAALSWLMGGRRATATTEDDRQQQNLSQTVRGLAWWVGISLAVVLLFSLSAGLSSASFGSGLRELLAVFTPAALYAAGSFSVGGLFGFLFGIPRTLQQDGQVAASPSGRGMPSGAEFRQSVNTNLEQISDWLTKILVGVGLTQLNTIPQRLWALAEHYPVSGSVPFAMALIIDFSICGFFAGYLLTRLFLAGAFVVAEEAQRWLRQQAQTAQVLSEAGAHDKAATQFEKALQGIDAATPKSVKRQIYEGLVYNALYQEPPRGFETGIEYARRYVSEEPTNPSAQIYVYLAAAYGQQADYEQRNRNRPEVRQAARDGALDAIKKALELDPNQKALLKSLWDRNDKTKPPEENDLEVFHEDEEFRKLLE